MSAGPLQISGFPGWVGWLFIHIAFLTGYRNRLGAILTWWSAFTRDRRRERAFTTREVGVVADVYAAVIPTARTGEPASHPASRRRPASRGTRDRRRPAPGGLSAAPDRCLPVIGTRALLRRPTRSEQRAAFRLKWRPGR